MQCDLDRQSLVCDTCIAQACPGKSYFPQGQDRRAATTARAIGFPSTYTDKSHAHRYAQGHRVAPPLGSSKQYTNAWACAASGPVSAPPVAFALPHPFFKTRARVRLISSSTSGSAISLSSPPRRFSNTDIIEGKGRGQLQSGITRLSRDGCLLIKARLWTLRELGEDKRRVMGHKEMSADEEGFARYLLTEIEGLNHCNSSKLKSCQPFHSEYWSRKRQISQR